jgi:hypothetical protein
VQEGEEGAHVRTAPAAARAAGNDETWTTRWLAGMDFSDEKGTPTSEALVDAPVNASRR